MRTPADFLYGLYERRIAAGLDGDLPFQVGVMLDGNRRWARSVGLQSSDGHRAGADRRLLQVRVVAAFQTLDQFPKPYVASHFPASPACLVISLQ